MTTTALITGASSGIGREMAKLHAAQKGNLVLVARSGDKLHSLQAELQEKHGIQVSVIPQDLTLPGAAKTVYDQTQQEGIVVDYLINNAGFGGQGFFHERQWEDDARMIQLNVMALTELTRYYLNDMVARKSGKVLNVSSTASLMPGPLQAVYFATKAYVRSFSNALSSELKDTGITVTNLMPGATATGFASTSGMDKTELFKQTASAETVAKDGYEGMLAGKMDVITGVSFGQRLMFKSVPFMPKKLIMEQVKGMQKTQ